MSKTKHSKLSPHRNQLTFDESGIREARLTKKATPVGHVAYCTPCNWSTGICVGMDDKSGRTRAEVFLANHRKTSTHRANLRAR